MWGAGGKKHNVSNVEMQKEKEGGDSISVVFGEGKKA